MKAIWIFSQPIMEANIILGGNAGTILLEQGLSPNLYYVTLELPGPPSLKVVTVTLKSNDLLLETCLINVICDYCDLDS